MTNLPKGVHPIPDILIAAALRTFLDRGYRPTIRSHALHYSDDFVAQGYAVLSGIHDLWAEADAEPGEVVPLSAECIGWMVDAKDATGADRQHIIGGTFARVGEAMAYALHELDKYAPERVPEGQTTPPPCTTCSHPYGEHDGWHMLGVSRKDWTPRWGGACGFSVDFHHTCPCARYRSDPR